RTALFINYEEWGGFFHPVVPPRVADVRGTPTDPAGPNDFGQLGFRVPCTVVSPYARRGALASQVINNSGVFFEHCSILRYIESLFLRGRYLTARDRYARNIGPYVLDLSQAPRLDAAAIVDALPRALFQSCPCEGEVLEGTLVGDPIEDGAGDGFAQLAEVIEDLSGIPLGSPPPPAAGGAAPPPARAPPPRGGVRRVPAAAVGQSPRAGSPKTSRDSIDARSAVSLGSPYTI